MSEIYRLYQSRTSKDMIIQGNCLDRLKELLDNSVDAVVTDPPYGLSFMGKKWDYDVPSVEIWAECLRVLKPGGYLLAFAGTRTQHRMAVRIEDAGFEIRDMIAWVYGSGFPKSLNIGKAVDKLQGNEREITGTRIKKAGDMTSGNFKRGGDYPDKELTDTKGTSEWEGWGTALKPALEPITVARKPLSEKSVAENVLKWGTGGINIDESRVDVADNEKESFAKEWDRFQSGSKEGTVGYVKQDGEYDLNQNRPQGRFPANLIHDGSDEVVSGFPNNTHRFFYTPKASKSERNRGIDNTAIVLIEWSIWNEKHTTQEVKKAELLVDTGILQPKDTEESGIQPSDASGWNTLLFGKSLTAKYQKDIKSTILTETNSTTTSQIYNWLALLLTKEYIADVSLEITNGGSPAESVEPSRVLATTMSEVLVSRLGVKNAVLGTQLKISVKEGRSGHPTVKPVALMEYLVKLVSREGAVVLDPFMGSGSTGVACKNLGRKFIGIEQEPEYVHIAKKRIDDVQPQLSIL